MENDVAYDFFHTPIKIGDTVVFMQLGYRCLQIGKVVNLTPTTVLIEHERFNVGGTQTRQSHGQVIVKR